MIGSRQIHGFEALTIGSADGELEAAFVPGAGMVCCSLRHRGEEVLGQRNGLSGYAERRSTMGIPLLYPWANRLGADRFQIAGHTVDLGGDPAAVKRDDQGLAMHGLLTAARGWRVKSHRAAGSGAELVASFAWSARPELLALFPFAHRLTLAARIESGALRMETTVAATGGDPVPVAFGFHPYLTLPGLERGSWMVELPVGEQLALDERGLPSGASEAVRLDSGRLRSDRLRADDRTDQRAGQRRGPAPPRSR